jgi:hypothetical protein
MPRGQSARGGAESDSDDGDNARLRQNPFVSAPYLLEQQARRFVLIERREGRGPKMKQLEAEHVDDFFAYNLVERYNDVRALAEEQEKFSGGQWPTRLSVARALSRSPPRCCFACPRVRACHALQIFSERAP